MEHSTGLISNMLGTIRKELKQSEYTGNSKEVIVTITAAITNGCNNDDTRYADNIISSSTAKPQANHLNCTISNPLVITMRMVTKAANHMGTNRRNLYTWTISPKNQNPKPRGWTPTLRSEIIPMKPPASLGNDVPAGAYWASWGGSIGISGHSASMIAIHSPTPPSATIRTKTLLVPFFINWGCMAPNQDTWALTEGRRRV